jgi:YD repeat-containing protein
VRENDQRADTTTVYTYTNGNITGKKVYKYTLGNVGEEIKSTSYGYSNSEWRDLLTSFNGQAVTYDEIGNPLTFGSKSFEWCGRQLERITDGDNTYVYAYNTDGDRVSKTVNGVKTEYFYNGSILAGQKTGDETLIFMYDNNGDAFGFIYNGEEYYYIKNVQNDIVAIADKNGDIVANYYYDAWGNVTQITGNTALAQTNPLRYRSYYYDSETGALLSSSKTGFKDTGIFTPYAAAIYDLSPDVSLYASLTEIYKPQANYLSGPPGRARPLDPITGRNYELGAKASLLGGALNASAALYRIERKGEAVLDPAWPDSDNSGLSCCYVAQGRIISEGLDLELSGEIAPDWQLFAGYTWNHNKNTRDDVVFSALTPRHMLKLWTEYTLPGDWSKWSLGAGVTVKSAQASTGTARIAGTTQAYDIRQGGYAVWDAHVGYRIDDRWQMDLNVNNLFDKDYYAALGTPTGGNWYGEPRNATLTLRGRF